MSKSEDMARRVAERHLAKIDRSDPDLKLPPPDPDTHEVDPDTGEIIGNPVPDPARREKRPRRR